jgi:hypothetical protein
MEDRMLGTRCAERLWGAVSLTAFAAAVAGCGGAVVLTPEQEIPLIQQQYRRVGGSSSGILASAKKAFERMSIVVADERPGSAIIGRMNVAKKPVYVYFKIASGDWVSVRLYNLSDAEQEKWRTRIFKELKDEMRGTPTEPGRVTGTRSKRG